MKELWIKYKKKIILIVSLVGVICVLLLATFITGYVKGCRALDKKIEAGK